MDKEEIVKKIAEKLEEQAGGRWVQETEKLIDWRGWAGMIETLIEIADSKGRWVEDEDNRAAAAYMEISSAFTRILPRVEKAERST